MSPAGFWQRYAAWSIDAAIISVPVAVIAWPRWQSSTIGVSDGFAAVVRRVAELTITGLRSADDPLLLARAWLDDVALPPLLAHLQSAVVDMLQPPAVGFLLLATIYWIAFECSPWQATPGKRMLGLSVTDLRRQRFGLPRAALRHAAGSLSWLTLNLGHVVAAWPPQKRALHDYIAGTRVWRAGSDTLPAWAQVWLGLQAVATIAATAWVMRAMSGALQIAIDSAL